jgi:ATP-binding cassette, subfamily B, bacterial HlyB/CyaB
MNSNTHTVQQPAKDMSPPKIDTALWCLSVMAQLHDISVDIDQLHHKYCSDKPVLNMQSFLLASKELGFKSKHKSINTVDKLKSLPLPAILIDKDNNFFILAQQKNDHFLIQQAGQAPLSLSSEQLQVLWNQQVILFTHRNSEQSWKRKFDIHWFIPAILKYKRLLIEVIIISFIIQFFALVTPLFFQVIMDKVLVHKGLNTLNVIGVGLVVIILFEIALNYIRSYVFAHTTNRIDVELGANLFRHLLSLPISYFESRRTGDSMARIRELENIRSFLTSNSLTLLLDLVFALAFLGLMFYYSPFLTLIVVISLPLYFIVSFIITPILKKRLEEKFNRQAENQAFLVESIHAIQTVKTSALEPKWITKWDNQLASYISSSFKTGMIANAASYAVQLISKLTQLAITYFGAKLVIEQKLSIGELIAFNMLAGQVAQPIIRLAQIWTDFQQVGISIERLADILNAPSEKTNQKNSMPKIKGTIQLQDISFAYAMNHPDVIKQLNLTIPAGQTIGIVGGSGSGKSTLTKLIQGLYQPREGKILIDGIDISLTDISSIRRQIGVVLQENILFTGSIAYNIAVAAPTAPLDVIVQAAQMAGAHDFIVDLPNGYDTVVGENGTGLSGGQRQRIAIARALITNPRLLIFDEATSALDYESERIIQKNMQIIAKNRTVIIIAHRLSAVRHAHNIIVMDKGCIIEQGHHTELLTNPDGHYAYLHQLQHTA